jgi:YD repeat-containing protein
MRPTPRMHRSVFDFAGRLVATEDAAGNRTDMQYDALGRTTDVLSPDPDGNGPLNRPHAQYVYDAAGRVTTPSPSAAGWTCRRLWTSRSAANCR